MTRHHGSAKDFDVTTGFSGVHGSDAPRTVMTIFGTRPEVIKLAPVIRGIESQGQLRTINVASGQHTTLLYPFVTSFGLRIDHDLRVMEPGQTPNSVCSRVLAALDRILETERPDMVLVQGDTTTALAGALAAFHRRIPVGHVEAGLRSGDRHSPFPEEMNRRLIGGLATMHFAATARNVDTLRSEGVPPDSIWLTGNPVVDALKTILVTAPQSEKVNRVIHATAGLRRVLLTTHRRESFGEYMTESLAILRRFVETHPDVALLFPVHPNPVVVETTRRILRQHPRIHLLEPLAYEEFIQLLLHAWLIVSDSGGVQEEAPSLGKPLIILRENTERPEAITCGIARLVGPAAARLATMLEEVSGADSWVERVDCLTNPFGDGDAGVRIAAAISQFLGESREAVATVN
jgi:UDP-N-acetylglucosamine 2-epimerase (non-hydrolysing)